MYLAQQQIRSVNKVQSNLFSRIFLFAPCCVLVFGDILEFSHATYTLIEVVSRFPATTILWVLSFCVIYVGHYASDYATYNEPRTSAVARQRGNRSNNKLNCHLVGTLTLHWRPLWTFSKPCMELRNIILFTIAGFTSSYARYGKPCNGYDVMQLHARIWKGLLLNNIVPLALYTFKARCLHHC